MSTLAGYITVLRGLVALDRDSRLLDIALVNAMEELAEAVDSIRGLVDPDDSAPGDDEDHLGTI